MTIDQIVERLTKALQPCRHCEYDEAEGELFCHCEACCHRMTCEAWHIVSNINSAKLP